LVKKPGAKEKKKTLISFGLSKKKKEHKHQKKSARGKKGKEAGTH